MIPDADKKELRELADQYGMEAQAEEARNERDSQITTGGIVKPAPKLPQQGEIDLGKPEKLAMEHARYKTALVKISNHEPRSEEVCALSQIACNALLGIIDSQPTETE